MEKVFEIVAGALHAARKETDNIVNAGNAIEIAAAKVADKFAAIDPGFNRENFLAVVRGSKSSRKVGL